MTPQCDLAPSILSFDLTNLTESVQVMGQSGAGVVHLDVMDGCFVPPITFGDAYVKWLRPSVDTLFEAHLMVQSPENQFKAFADAGCQRIIFHTEATVHAHRLAQTLREMNVQPGIAINPGTPVENVIPLLDVVDLVLVMTVNPGWGGQKFLTSCLEKVSKIRTLRPDILIEVDGGIDPQTLPVARDAGANLFVVGSYLAKAPNLSEAVKGLVGQCR